MPIEILSVEEEQTTTPPPSGDSRPVIPRFRSLTIGDHVRLLLPFLVFGLVGIAARLKYPYWWPATDLVYFLANALIVVMVIGMILAVFSARLIVERVSDSLAQKLVGRGLPVELQGPIKDLVNTGFVRDHYVKSYTISPPKSGQVSIDIEVRFDVKNYADSVREYAPELSEEVSCKPEFRFLEYGIAGRKVHSFSDDKLASKVDTLGGIRRVAASAVPKISVWPIKTDRSVCHVTWRYRITMPEEYCDITHFNEPTIGATLHVQQLPPGMEFDAGGDDSLHHEAGSRSWFFDRPFIAGQHVRARWFRKS